MAFADRLVNPLGFQVTGYRRDAEAPPVPDAVAVQPVARTSMISESIPGIETPAAPVVATRAQAVSRATVRIVQGGVGGPFISEREVPANQIPMGSPLGSGPAVEAAAPTAESQQ
jgi:type IV secretion system protein VirB8